MKRIIAVLLTCLVAAPPASADPKLIPASQWDKVQKLGTGTKLVVTMADGSRVSGRLLFVDSATLLTLKADGPRLPRPVEEFLLGVGEGWAAVIHQGGVAQHQQNSLRVSEDGIFDGSMKLSDFAEVVHRAPREGVKEIAPSHGHAARWLKVGAAIAVIALIFLSGVNWD